jgi:sulfite oxidase
MARSDSREWPQPEAKEPLRGVAADLLRSDTAIRHSETSSERSRAAIDRSEAARRRSEAARQRAKASRKAAQAALARATVSGSHSGMSERREVADERHRLADQREVAADERDRKADARERIADTREAQADRREAEADRRERRADERERLLDERQRSVDDDDDQPAEERPEGRITESRMTKIKIEAAERAEKMADEADAYAAYLERTSARDGTGRRLALAQRERDIAAVERRNALKLRQAGTGPFRLEGLPRFTLTPDEGDEGDL